MRFSSLLIVFALLALIPFGTLSTAGQSTTPPGVYTTAQADAGRQQLQKNLFGACTDCHTTSLGGRSGNANETPALSSLPEDYQKLITGNSGRVPDLVGSAFRTRWAGRSTKDLTREFVGRFASSLSEETRLNLIAYILQANGATPGAQPLTMETDVEIRMLVPGDGSR
jgi:hypothetical protein